MNKDKLFSFLFKFKLFWVGLSVTLPFMHPHIIRQNDTLGVVVRYWLRWTQEPELIKPLYPALIQAGDQYGIHATEFPLLYIALAPLMAIPNPFAVMATRLVFLLFAIWLVYKSHQTWEQNKTLGLNSKLIHQSLFIFGCSSVYFYKFMPDFVAMMMVLIAVGLSFEKNYLFRSTFWASFGLLLKPTAILVFPIIFLAKRKRIIDSIFSWMLVSFLITIFYYTFITAELNSISDITPYFYSNFRNPFEQLINFFARPGDILKLIFKDIFTMYILLFILGDLLLNRNRYHFLDVKFWGVLLLQILMGAALDGNHSFVHDYYFVGTSFIVAIIFTRFYTQAKAYWIKLGLVILLLANLDKGVQMINRGVNHNTMWQLAKIRKSIPEGEYQIRTKKTRHAEFGPYLKLKENSSNASFGVYYKNDISDNLKGDVIMKTKDLLLYKF